MSRNGTVLSPPSFPSRLVFGESFEYCTKNWCVRNEIESLFTYNDGRGFNDIFGCEQTYDSTIEDYVANAPEDLRTVCQGDPLCIVEGVCGDISDAQAVIVNEEELRMERIQFDNMTPRPTASLSPSSPSSSLFPGPTTLGTPAPTTSLPPSMDPTPLPSQAPTTSHPPSDSPSALPSVSVQPSLPGLCSTEVTEVIQSGASDFSTTNATSIPFASASDFSLSFDELDDIFIEGDFPGCSKVLFEFEVDYSIQPAQELTYRLFSIANGQALFTDHIIPNHIGGSFTGSSGLQRVTATVDNFNSSIALLSSVNVSADATDTSGRFFGTLTYTLTVDVLESDCSCPMCDVCGDGSDPLDSEDCAVSLAFVETPADSIFCSALQSTLAYHCCSNKELIPEAACSLCGDGVRPPRSDVICGSIELGINFSALLSAALLDGLVGEIPPVCEEAFEGFSPDSRQDCCS